MIPRGCAPAPLLQDDSSLHLQSSAGALGAPSPAAPPPLPGGGINFNATQPGAGRPPPPASAKPHSAGALRAAHIAKYAAVPFAGQGLVSKEPSSGSLLLAQQQQQQQQLTPREQWRPEHFANGASGGFGSFGGGGASRPESPSRRSAAAAAEHDASLLPPNHHHMEQWGVWEPPRGADGKVPGWINYLLNRMDRLEGEVSELRRQAAAAGSQAGGGGGGGGDAKPSPVTVALEGFVTHEELRLHLQRAQEQQQQQAQRAAAAGGSEAGEEGAAQRALSAVGEAVKPVLARCTGLEERLEELAGRLDQQVRRSSSSGGAAWPPLRAFRMARLQPGAGAARQPSAAWHARGVRQRGAAAPMGRRASRLGDRVGRVPTSVCVCGILHLFGCLGGAGAQLPGISGGADPKHSTQNARCVPAQGVCQRVASQLVCGALVAALRRWRRQARTWGAWWARWWRAASGWAR